MTRTLIFLLSFLLASASASADEVRWQAFLVAGEAALTEKNYAEAEKLFRAALREASAFEKTDERRGITLNHLATTLSAQRLYGHAEPVLLQAMVVWEQSPPENELHLATTLHHLAGIYHARGEYEAAAEPLKRALAIRERSLPPDHAALKHTHQSLAALGEKLGKDHYVLQVGGEGSVSAKKAPAKPTGDKAVVRKKTEAPVRAAAKAPKTIITGEKTGRFVLHLASFKTVEGANQAWSRLKSNFAEVLGELSLTLQAADLGDQGIFQRILAGPVTQMTAARDLCERLKGAGQYCAVVPNPS